VQYLLIILFQVLPLPVVISLEAGSHVRVHVLRGKRFGRRGPRVHGVVRGRAGRINLQMPEIHGEDI
jgi:hypothetical protein